MLITLQELATEQKCDLDDLLEQISFDERRAQFIKDKMEIDTIHSQTELNAYAKQAVLEIIRNMKKDPAYKVKAVPPTDVQPKDFTAVKQEIIEEVEPMHEIAAAESSATVLKAEVINQAIQEKNKKNVSDSTDTPTTKPKRSRKSNITSKQEEIMPKINTESTSEPITEEVEKPKRKRRTRATKTKVEPIVMEMPNIPFTKLCAFALQQMNLKVEQLATLSEDDLKHMILEKYTVVPYGEQFLLLPISQLNDYLI